MKRMRSWLALLPGIVLAAGVVQAAGDSSYKVTARYQPGGDGGWDYITADPATQRIYVSRSTRVQVLDMADGHLVGEIPNTPGVHGVAVAPELNKGFTSNGRDSSVTVFDLKTLAVLTRIHIPSRNPDAILYDPDTKRVFTFNGGSANATAIDAAQGSVIGEVTLGGKPEAAVTDGKGEVFVNLEDSSAVVGFDAKTLAVKSRWPLAPGEEPTGLAIDRAHRRLFSACGNGKMVVLDAASGHVVTTVPIGSRTDGAAFDPASLLAISSNGEGTVTVVHEDTPEKFTLVSTDSTQRGARTISLDPKTHRLYLPTAQFGETPAATPENPRPRPALVPNSFTVLVLDRTK
jgi:DNA-binding beta-propeller fold protein YncE